MLKTYFNTILSPVRRQKTQNSKVFSHEVLRSVSDDPCCSLHVTKKSHCCNPIKLNTQIFAMQVKEIILIKELAVSDLKNDYTNRFSSVSYVTALQLLYIYLEQCNK